MFVLIDEPAENYHPVLQSLSILVIPVIFQFATLLFWSYYSHSVIFSAKTSKYPLLAPNGRSTLDSD